MVSSCPWLAPPTSRKVSLGSLAVHRQPLARVHVRDALKRWVPEADFVGVSVTREDASLQLRVRFRSTKTRSNAQDAPREIVLMLPSWLSVPQLIRTKIQYTFRRLQPRLPSLSFTGGLNT